MNLKSLFQRGKNLIRVGRAIRAVRKATDEDSKTWAKNYLVETLGQSRGLPVKLGQFMSLESNDYQDTLQSSIPPMPFEQVEEELEKAFQAPWKTIFKKLDKAGKAASLGQVHFGIGLDGTPLAIKIQYPEIAAAVETEMDFMGWLPKVGPVAKWGFKLDGYRDSFWNTFTEELDYLVEAEHQRNYHELALPLNDLIVPEVDMNLTRPTVLVQKREDGFSLDDAEKMNPELRQTIGRGLLEHYLYMLFRHGCVHADPHPGNFAFRQTGRNSYAVVLYDYGCILKIPDSVRLALLRVILALQNREPVDPVACLVAIGFDETKLQDIRSVLPALLNILFEPFLVDYPFDVKEWDLNRRFDLVAGEMKWWFRSSAPPNLIFLMRTLHGMSALLKRLDTKLSWKFVLEKTCGDCFSSAKSFQLPTCSTDNAIRFDGMARYLLVKVVKPNGNKVKLTMPARVAETLIDVIDPPVMESIVRQNIDLDVIQSRVLKSGFVPQVLFDLKDPERDVKVWLE
jgi:predicted unusual protein kinase regulating ubiquinone biosynthesis (AarF/ABC1/UbiB family)